MLTSKGGSYVYSDGTSFTPPVIHTSGNGWYYKPDELRTKQEIKSGKNKSWPRGEGDWRARDYIKTVLQKHHTERNWEKPVSCSNQRTYVSAIYGDSLTAAWWDETFGWVSIGISIRRDVDRQTKEVTHGITWRVDGTTLLGWLVERQIKDQREWALIQQKSGIPNPQTFVQAFVKDPFGSTLSIFPTVVATELDRVLNPPDLSNGDYQDNNRYELDQTLPAFISNNNGQFYIKGIIEEVFQSDVNWQTVERFFNALAFVGFNVQTQWTTGSRGWNDRSLTGISITIPKQGDTHMHKVTIKADNPNVEVECGYVQDEQRWMDRKQREAAEQMRELEDALASFEFEIDMERGE